MTFPLTGEERDRAEKEFAEYLPKLIARLRSRPPRGGGRHKTFDDYAREQGVGPINLKRLRELNPGPLYEGFEEDIKRMRRGLPAIGPRK